MAGGCNMNRNIPDLIRRGGFELSVDERRYIPGVRMLSYNYWGVAQATR
jgi:hypothetical protein